MQRRGFLKGLLAVACAGMVIPVVSGDVEAASIHTPSPVVPDAPAAADASLQKDDGVVGQFGRGRRMARQNRRMMRRERRSMRRERRAVRRERRMMRRGF